jgi:hypothetical protein
MLRKLAVGWLIIQKFQDEVVYLGRSNSSVDGSRGFNQHPGASIDDLNQQEV